MEHQVDGTLRILPQRPAGLARRGRPAADSLNWYCSSSLICSRQDPMPGNTTEQVATVAIMVPPDTPAGTYLHSLSATADNPDTNLANNGDWHEGRMLASGPPRC